MVPGSSPVIAVRYARGASSFAAFFRSLNRIPGGLARFIPCQPSAHYARLVHVGWTQCGRWTLFPVTSQRKEFPASSTCSIAPCCFVCSGLHVRYTDAFNGSYLFPSRHEQCVLVRARSAVDSLLCQSLVVALDTARSGEVLCFRLQQW